MPVFVSGDASGIKRPPGYSRRGNALYKVAHLASLPRRIIVAMSYFGPPDLTRPCWHCHWFDRMTNAGAACLHPQGCGCQPQPAFGCCSWMREPGADDEPGRLGKHASPKLHFMDDTTTRDYVRRRKRLDKIWEQARRAKMPAGTGPTMRGTSGLLAVSASSWSTRQDLAQAQAELDRLGVNQAIERGAL